MVATAIDARRKEKHGAAKADDLLDRMLAAEDPETGHRMSPQDLIHNMQFFIVAGHETTALALSWALYLLANSPEHQERARAQVTARLQGRVAEAADLPPCRSSSRCWKNPCGFIRRWGCWRATCWRKTNSAAAPCAPTTSCSCRSGRCIAMKCCGNGPSGSIPTASTAISGPKRDKYQYLPFGAGPRVCVGADFAMMQAGIILATLIGRFRFRPSQPQPHPVMTMTVRPEPGVFLEIQALG